MGWGLPVSYMTEPFLWPWALAAEEEAGGQMLLAARPPTPPVAISTKWGGCRGRGEGRKVGVRCQQAVSRAC